MSSSNAIVLAGAGRRRPSPFSIGLRETVAIGAAVKSTVVMPNAAAQPGTRSKLTAEQMEARQQQRAEDDELIRAAQKGDRQAFDALVRRYDRSVLRLALHMLGNEQDAQTQEPTRGSVDGTGRGRGRDGSAGEFDRRPRKCEPGPGAGAKDHEHGDPERFE